MKSYARNMQVKPISHLDAARTAVETGVYEDIQRSVRSSKEEREGVEVMKARLEWFERVSLELY